MQLDPIRLKEVDQNIVPFAHVAVAGHDNSALAVLTAPKSTAAANVPTTGEQAFTQVCSACHAHGYQWRAKNRRSCGVGTANRPGQGSTCTRSAINGKGNMPPRGGTTWPDAAIRMSVDYMVSLNK